MQISSLLAFLLCLLSSFVIASEPFSSDQIEEVDVWGHSLAQLLLNSVISASRFEGEELDTTKADRLEDISPYSPGVLASSGTAGMESNFFVRGYRSDSSNMYVNGHLDNQRLFIRDLATVERVDILKGHSAVLLGGGTPGGSIHYATKQPEKEFKFELGATGGSYEKRRLDLDATGALTATLDYRIIAVHQEANSFIENVGNDRKVLLTSLSWQYHDSGEIRLETEYDRLQNPYSFGIVRADEKILYDVSYVDPRSDSNRRNLRTSLYLKQLLNEGWSVNALANHVTVNRDDLLFGFYYKLDEASLAGFWRDTNNRFWQTNAKVELLGDVEIYGKRNRLVFGIAYNKSDNDLDSLRSINAFTLDPTNPEFNRPEPIDQSQIANFHYRDKDRSVYFVDQFALSSSLILTAGLRYSQFEAKDRLQDTVTVDNSALAKTLGLSWQLSDGISLYGNYSESFQPTASQDSNGNFFDPREAEQIEVGIRLQLPRSNHHVAIYDLTQSNLLTVDPLDRDFAVPTGERRTQGIELESLMKLNESMQLQLTYSHMDNEITKPIYSLDGNVASGIPRNMGSLRFDWMPAAHERLKLYLGLIAIGKRFGDAGNTFRLPGYGRTDIGARYKFSRYTFRFHVENLFDKRYVAAPFAEDDLYQGKRRDVSVSVFYDW